MNWVIAGCMGALTMLLVGRLLPRSAPEVQIIVAMMIGAVAVTVAHKLEQGTFSALAMIPGVLIIVVVGGASLAIARKRTGREQRTRV